MYKLCENNNIVNIESWGHSGSEYYDTRFNLISPKILFDNEYEWILFENNRSELVIPINSYIMRQLIDIHSIEFKFEKCTYDTPPLDEDINTIHIDANDYSAIINALIMYNSYVLINYLPYTDFAIDHMPMLTQVCINGTPSDLFDRINQYIAEHFSNICQIVINKSGGYHYQYDYEIQKPKKILEDYLKVNHNSIIYYRASKFETKMLKYTHHVEVSLQWFDKIDESMTEYQDSVHDDYFACSSGIPEVLTLCTTYEYLISYYFNELKYMKNNHFLIIKFTGYFRINDKLQGAQIITHNKDRYWNRNLFPFICSKLYSIVR